MANRGNRSSKVDRTVLSSVNENAWRYLAGVSGLDALSSLASWRTDLQRDPCPFIDRLEVREPASIIKTSLCKYIQSNLRSLFLRLIAALDRKPEMKDTLAACLQKTSLRSVPVSRLAKLQLGVLDVRELIAHLQEGLTIVAVQFVRIHRRKISPRANADRLVILHSVLDITDHDADVVQLLKNWQLFHFSLRPYSVLAVGRKP